MKRIARALAVAFLATVALAPAVASAQPSSIDFTFVQNANTYETLGWASTGAITDSGDWQVTRLVAGSPKTMLFGDVDTVQSSSLGSFRLQWHGGTTPVGGIAATWRLTDGTGAYANMRGEGRWSQVLSGGYLTFHCSGVVNVAP
jgi:hypothetical protein